MRLRRRLNSVRIYNAYDSRRRTDLCSLSLYAWRVGLMIHSGEDWRGVFAVALLRVGVTGVVGASVCSVPGARSSLAGGVPTVSLRAVVGVRIVLPLPGGGVAVEVVSLSTAGAVCAGTGLSMACADLPLATEEVSVEVGVCSPSPARGVLSTDIAFAALG